ncbi:hypothetical protein [Coleofasciculus sp. FACHB-1120]|uniref:hypothetical protein n=1 Tax=Coleofasciculus sp. FACHB-1120 TaxID=2692783 RepID=UPI001687CF4C|nr:hypothetical protein [Coleofasciculus sp. FACHB-1120]MBD2743849.1 hypothetical protein [Coleofasciculus sp. FACHB-1120]
MNSAQEALVNPVHAVVSYATKQVEVPFAYYNPHRGKVVQLLSETMTISTD